MDTKKTLQNLHQKFPAMTLDDTILDCIVLDSPIVFPTVTPNTTDKIWYDTKVTCKNLEDCLILRQ